MKVLSLLYIFIYGLAQYIDTAIRLYRFSQEGTNNILMINPAED